MSDPKQTRETSRPSGIGGSGMQGIDKAPGEKPARSTENLFWETQKGKNKVDGDPSLEGDKPVQQDLSGSGER